MTHEEIEKDRSEGTSGPWRVGPVDDTVVIAPDGSEVAAIDGDYNEPDLWPVMEANARRIARLPELEQAYLDLTAEVQGLTDALNALTAAAYEAAAQRIDANPSPCSPAYPDAWSDEAVEHYSAGQLDAAISFCHAIRALTPADAIAAQAARDRKMKAEGLRKAAAFVDSHTVCFNNRRGFVMERSRDPGEDMHHATIAKYLIALADKTEKGEA